MSLDKFYKFDLSNDLNNVKVLYGEKTTNDKNVLKQVIFSACMETTNDIYYKITLTTIKIISKSYLKEVEISELRPPFILNPFVIILKGNETFEEEILLEEFDYVRFKSAICSKEGYDRNSIFRVKKINKANQEVCFYKTLLDNKPYQDIYFPNTWMEKITPENFPTYDMIFNENSSLSSSETNVVFVKHIPTGKRDILKIINKTIAYKNHIKDGGNIYYLSETFYFSTEYYIGEKKLADKNDYEIIQSAEIASKKIECKKIKGFPIMFSENVPETVKCETLII